MKSEVRGQKSEVKFFCLLFSVICPLKDNMKVAAVIPSAGTGRRMKERFKGEKPYLRLGDRPILAHTLALLEGIDFITQIVVVVNGAGLEATRKLLNKYKIKKIARIVEGGPTRRDSVYRGLKVVDRDADLVLIHDGARPLLAKDIVSRAVEAAQKFGAAIAAIPATSTIKEIGKKGMVRATLKREQVRIVQTPQVFKRSLIIEAYERAAAQDIEATDDSFLVEKLGHKVKVVMGSYENIKITTPQDLTIAEAILKERTKLTTEDTEKGKK